MKLNFWTFYCENSCIMIFYTGHLGYKFCSYCALIMRFIITQLMISCIIYDQLLGPKQRHDLKGTNYTNCDWLIASCAVNHDLSYTCTKKVFLIKNFAGLAKFLESVDNLFRISFKTWVLIWVQKSSALENDLHGTLNCWFFSFFIKGSFLSEVFIYKYIWWMNHFTSLLLNVRLFY